jgi:hypothetical protein
MLHYVHPYNFLKIKFKKKYLICLLSSQAHFTLGVRANVQPKSNIPICAKVEINPKGFTLRVKVDIGKKKQSAFNY